MERIIGINPVTEALLNKEKNIDEKIKEIEDEEKKEFFRGDL